MSDLTTLMLMDRVLEAADRLAILVSESSPASVETDWRTYDAICLGLIRIGECVNDFPDAVKVQLVGVNWRDIVALRNRIAHGYDTLHVARIWETAALSVPPFAAQIRQLQAEMERGKGDGFVAP